MTYLGRGITGPGDKGPVVRGQEKRHDVLWQTVLGIRIRNRNRIRMFLGLPDPDPFVRSTNQDPNPAPIPLINVMWGLK
jgi:hypothetical protein